MQNRDFAGICEEPRTCFRYLKGLVQDPKSKMKKFAGPIHLCHKTELKSRWTVPFREDRHLEKGVG